jgi:hypothetical protein
MSPNLQKKHPFFGHPITNAPLAHHSHPLSLNAPLVHLKAVIKKVEHDEVDNGAKHMHFMIHQVTVLDIHGAAPASVGAEIFCVIRYGDTIGLANRIPGLQSRQEIELQGEYIESNNAYLMLDNPNNDPVLHFTHHPVGFVYYQGVRYE